MPDETVINTHDTILTDNVLKMRCHPERTNKRAVFLVHGFTGDWVSTWKCNNASLPDLIFNDPELADFDVCTFQFRTTWLKASPIQNIAVQLRAQLDVLHNWAEKNKREYELVLLAHSMGGLVCMRLVLDWLRDEKIPPISGLLLYGVPSTGTELVKIARLLGAGVALKIPFIRSLIGLVFKGQRQVASLETASEFLQTLHAEWAKRVVNGGDPNFSGTRMWLPVRVVTGEDDCVVSEAAGKGMYGAIDWHTLPYGHIALVKPEGCNDQRYQPLQSFLKRCRQGKSPLILDQLWNISRSVWASRETKLIQDWKYRLELFSTKSHALQQIWLDSGFSLCKVSLCEYTTRLVEQHIYVAAAIGNIATEEVWKKKPVYVHQINIDAVPTDVQNGLIKWIDTRHALFSGEQCWDDMFFEFTLKLAHPVGSADSVDLDYIGTYRDGRALVRHYAVPKAHKNLIGEDVQIKITYESVIPKQLTSFEAFLPWLTQSCDLRISLNGALSYFVVVPKALVQTSVKIRAERYAHKAEAAINSTGLLLAESAVVLRWGFLESQ